MANSISCNPALAGRGPDALRSIETTRVHHAAWRRGRLAACGAGAAEWVVELSHLRRCTRECSSHRPPQSLTEVWNEPFRVCTVDDRGRFRAQRAHGVDVGKDFIVVFDGLGVVGRKDNL